VAVITVGGKIVGSRSTMVIVLAPGTPGEDVRFAEEMTQLVTGRQPSTWTDGTGTITICDSQQPVGGGWRTNVNPGRLAGVHHAAPLDQQSSL
jgi:hypothetical protein